MLQKRSNHAQPYSNPEEFTCMSSPWTETERPSFSRYTPPHFDSVFRGSPAALLISISPSANHLLALTNCTTLMPCLIAIIGKLTPAITQGQKESILFARASSNAAALCGFIRSDAAGETGFPG